MPGRHYIAVAFWKERFEQWKGTKVKTADLTIEGMSCGHCVMSIRKELGKLAHVRVEDVQIGKGRVTYDEAKVTVDQISKAVEDAGYRLIS